MKRSTISNLRSHSGFTLMELLIVIAIIGILVSIAIASYTSAQRKSRDTRRINDMKSVQNAWEQYYADNSGTYPSDCSYSVTPTPGVMSGKYLPGGMPYDPKSGPTPTPYTSIKASWSSCSDSAYCFCAGLERDSNADTDCGTTPAPTPYVGVYCVRSLQ